MSISAREAGGHGDRVYEERQRFGAVMYLVLAVVAVVSIATPLIVNAMVQGEATFATLAAMGMAAAVVLIVVNMLDLRTSVDRYAIRVRLGSMFPVMNTRIALADVTGVHVVQYRTVRDGDRSGKRFGKLNEKWTAIWNARGDGGVLVETRTRPYMIGSKTPEALCAAIERARSRG